MDKQEASEWMQGIRSSTNMVPQYPHETWLLRVAQADAALTEQAYWILRAYKEKLLENDDVEIRYDTGG